jgi:hypothetical protein
MFLKQRNLSNHDSGILIEFWNSVFVHNGIKSIDPESDQWQLAVYFGHSQVDLPSPLFRKYKNSLKTTYSNLLKYL